ncbi:MAG: hypothetical protein ACOZCO_16040 [Bacteroidota bacterium]|jgi:hypothetical protein
MQLYLQTLGWWNFIGSIMMLFFINEKFGNNMLVVWTKMFKDDFKLDYWGKLWLMWAAGINIFFGLINILSVHWGHLDVMTFLTQMDVGIYIVFVGLVIWGMKAGRMGSGAWSAFVIFGVWIGWGIFSLMQ